MAPRLELQQLLSAIPGVTKAYFQPPATVKMQYPCIVYALDDIRTEFAGNLPYKHTKRYQVTVIHDDPDSDIPDRLVALPMSQFDRRYTANNLHHSVITLYF